MSRYHIVWFTKPKKFNLRMLKFCIIGEERTKKGRTHWQGYVELNRTLSLRRLKKIFGRTAHIERARKDAIHNMAYCTKEGRLFHVFGSPAEPRAALLLAHFSNRQFLQDAQNKKASSTDQEEEERHTSQAPGVQEDQLQELRKSPKSCAI